MGVGFQMVACVDTSKDGLAVVEVVAALTEVEVEDIDGVDFLYLVVLVAYLNMFGDGFRYAVGSTADG